MQAGSRSSLLLRCQTSLLPFLAPAIPSTFFVTVSSPHRPYNRRLATVIWKQSISLHTQIRQASSATATVAAPEQQTPEDDAPRSDPAPQHKPSWDPGDVAWRQDSLLERMRRMSKPGQAKEDSERETKMKALLDASGLDKESALNIDGENSLSLVEQARAADQRKDFTIAQMHKDPRQGRIVRNMNMPRTNDSVDFPIHQEQPTRQIATIKSRPSIGRTVLVMPERGQDLGRALKKLEVECAINKVRTDRKTQRFYERAGLKRKRLKSVRWRSNFKQGFKAVVAKVKAMRRKGW
ncbi:MAG: hypothetical protein LQ352_007673 [Teloschistes flavicans]|nr:MAG: hypothetical protein LQ352_007673 [Teloschistes flavicans]